MESFVSSKFRRKKYILPFHSEDENMILFSFYPMAIFEALFIVFLLLQISSLCSLLLSLETPNDVRSVALYTQNIKATSKGSDQTARIRRLI